LELGTATDMAVCRDELRPEGESGVGRSIFLARVRRPPLVPHRTAPLAADLALRAVCAHRGSGASARSPRGE